MMNEEDRSKAFQKMGFWEADKKIKLLSCSKCKDSVLASKCIEKITKATGSRVFKENLELFCPNCDSLLIGASV